MAGKKNNNTRIEPTFDAPGRKRADTGLRVSAADRAVPSGAKSSRKTKANPKASAAARKSSARRKRKTTKRSSAGLIGRFVYWSLVLGIWGAIGLAGVLGYFAVQLPQSANWHVPERPPNARIITASGELLANRGATGGAAMRLNEMSPYIPMAVIAIEDRRFKHHYGFDPIGFTRAMVTNVVAGRLVQGGSTLTQQLAKNLFLKPERTVERKVQELILAFWLETKYTKDEILEMYLNRVYFGSGAYGVDAAARRYFSKSARDVNLAEAAILAGLLKAPSKLSPARNPEGAKERSLIVLSTMKRSDFITQSEMEKARSMKAEKAKRYWSGSEHYVADFVMKRIPALIGEMRDDIIIDTTLDYDLQRVAGEAIEETLAENSANRNVSQGALVAMSPYGAIRAMVGGREYANSQYNRAVDAKRQPGSAFKPFAYLAGLEAGRTPQSVRQDAPVRIGKWTPVNYDRKYRGPVTLDAALAKSLNTVAAQMVMEVGPQTVVETAHRLGIRSDLKANASIALGTSEVTLLELTSAYAPFANGGRLAEPYVIHRITDIEGKVLFERKTFEGPVVVRPRELGMMNAMLRSVVSQGTGKAAAFSNRDLAGKTGTSQNSRDALFVGYTADLVTGVWFGNDDGSATKKVSGGSLPARTWQTVMKKAHADLPPASLPGNYQPEPAEVPSAMSGIGLAQSGNQSDIGRLVREDRQQRVEPRRRPLSEINGDQPQREKPRTILDLIFGG